MTKTGSLKGWHITLWIVQVLLAAVNIMAGSMKLLQPIEEMSKTIPWVSEGSLIGVNLVFAALACFVYWGRTKKVPIPARGGTPARA